MDIIQKLEKIYLDNEARDFSFLSDFRIPKTEISTIAAMYDFNKYDSFSTIDSFVQHRNVLDNVDNLKRELSLFLDFYKRTLNDFKYSEFIELIAKIYIEFYRNGYIENGHLLPILPNNPIDNSIYIDLASGPDFINFYDSISQESTYYLIDKSAFSCKVLELKRKEYNLQNIIILNKGVEELSEKDFNGTVGVIRAKNLFCYIQYNPDLIISLQRLLAKNGIFVFQEQTQSQTIKDLGYLQVKDLFRDNWVCFESEGDNKNPLDLDTLKFIKK